MFEITNFLKLEITVIESGKEHENVLPYGAADMKDLADKIKKLLDCDDVQIKEIQQFPFDKSKDTDNTGNDSKEDAE